MPSSGALPQTLKSITNIKIREFAAQHAVLEGRVKEVEDAAAQATDPRMKIKVLLEGIATISGNAGDAKGMDDGENWGSSSAPALTRRATRANIRRFLFQSKYDVSVTPEKLQGWIKELEQDLEHFRVKNEHSAFYSKLVQEWLDELDKRGQSDAAKGEGEQAPPAPRAELEEQKNTWTTLVLSPAEVSKDKITNYLDKLFMSTPPARQALDVIRRRLTSYGNDLSSQKSWVTVQDLEWISNAVLRTDLLSKEKAVILKEFTSTPSVAQEVADVLNMRLSSLDKWKWPEEGMLVEMRRELNGKYRFFMEEDLIDSLLLQYVGTKWAVEFRSAFFDFQGSRAWVPFDDHLSRQERERRNYFLGNGSTRPAGKGRSINSLRFETFKENYFMSQLPETEQQSGEDPYSDDRTSESRLTPMEKKHSILHLLVSEALVQCTLHDEFAVVNSDFKWFGPSLPHLSILTVLEYFGVPQNWLALFHSFLEAPVKFASKETPRPRKRGIPMNHDLSDSMGEALLFCMDYAVNKATKGAYLYRLHDDIWFWGQQGKCEQAWQTMEEFASTVGLELNAEKTGSCSLKAGPRASRYACVEQYEAPPQHSSKLPEGDIRWGMLVMNPKTGRFAVDQAQVDEHIEELRRQLKSCESVFSWVQAWNSYFGRFFVNNFGKPAACLGRQQVDMALETLSRIERALFGGDGGVTDHLRKMVADRFSTKTLPAGFFYFPVELGGMGLLNPYLPLLAMREDLTTTPEDILKKQLQCEEDQYHGESENFEKNGPRNKHAGDFPPGSVDTFMSYEEYISKAEAFSELFVVAYKKLTGVADERAVDQSPLNKANQLTLDDSIKNSVMNQDVISDSWYRMSPYWKWVAELYQVEIVDTFGTLAPINREALPLGVVQTLKKEKTRWEP